MRGAVALVAGAASGSAWPGRRSDTTRHHYIIRQLGPADRPLLRDLLGRLSERTRQQRYGSPGALEGERAEAEIDRLLAQRDRDLVLVAAAPGQASGELVGIVELRPFSGDAGGAEIGIVIRDDRQGQGIGTLLLRDLCARATRRGIARLHFLLLAQNFTLRHMLSRLGPVATRYLGDGMLVATLQLPAGRGSGAGATLAQG